MAAKTEEHKYESYIANNTTDKAEQKNIDDNINHTEVSSNIEKTNIEKIFPKVPSPTSQRGQCINTESKTVMEDTYGIDDNHNKEINNPEKISNEEQSVIKPSISTKLKSNAEMYENNGNRLPPRIGQSNSSKTQTNTQMYDKIPAGIRRSGSSRQSNTQVYENDSDDDSGELRTKSPMFETTGKLNTGQTVAPGNAVTFETYHLPILDNTFTDNLQISGTCKFKLHMDSASIELTSGSFKTFTWYYKQVRQYGTRDNCFFMDVGRRSVTGPGSLLLGISDINLGQEVTRNMKKHIEKMSMKFYLPHEIPSSEDLAEERFSGDIIRNKFSKRLKLSGSYTLQVDITGLSLHMKNTDRMLYWWPLKNIRKYTAKDGKFTFEGGRNSMAGEGSIEMKTNHGSRILDRLQFFNMLASKKKQALIAGQRSSSSGPYQDLMFNKPDDNHTYQELSLPQSPT